MPAGPTDLIIHQYNHEPAFSVKTRLMLGFNPAPGEEIMFTHKMPRAVSDCRHASASARRWP